MRIGIDISQLAYAGTGVASFLKNLVEEMILQDTENEYVLFFASLRGKFPVSKIWNENGIPTVDNVQTNVKKLTIKQFKIPPTFLDILWNRLHIVPIETFIGPLDVFISSDWVEPPSKAKKVTILYDLIVYKYPEETHNRTDFNLKNFILSANIVASQKRRLEWVKKEVDKIICISEATKKDAIEILRIPEKRLEVVYPGL